MKNLKIILIVMLFFQTSCGYKIVNNKENFRFNIIDYKLIGDKKINNILNRNFERFENNQDSTSNFVINSNNQINKTITSRNSSGEALTYVMEIVISLEIYENNKLLNTLSFKENVNYDDLDSKFELKQYENILIKDLTNQIVIKINNQLNSLK